MKRAIIFMIALFFTTPSLACECTMESFSINASRNNLARAAVILEGTVASVGGPQSLPAIEDSDSSHLPANFSPVKIEPIAVYKGEAGDEVTAYVDTVTTCGGPIHEGETRLFLLDDHNGALVAADMCGNFIADNDRKALREGKFDFETLQP